MRRHHLATLPSLLCGLGISSPAAEITLISGAAIEPGLQAAAAAFERNRVRWTTAALDAGFQKY